MDIKYAYTGTRVCVPGSGIQGKIVDLKMSESGLNRVYATIQTDDGGVIDKPLDLLLCLDDTSKYDSPPIGGFKG